MNKELFELHTEIKSFIEDKSSSFILDLPTTLFKRELKAVYRKLVLIRVAELLSGINLLATENNGIGCVILCRSLFELYLQIAFIFKLDNLHGYRSFYYFADYQSVKKLKNVEEKHMSSNESYRDLLNRISIIENEVSYFDYIGETEKFRIFFEKNYPNSKFTINSKSNNWWGGLNPDKLATFLGIDTERMLFLHYWQYSNLTHSSPRGIIEGYNNIHLNNQKWVETTLVNSCDIAARIIEIVFKGNPEYELYASICGIQGRLNDICGKLESSLPSKC